MKILQLCHKPPFPPTEGGSIAMYNLARGLVVLGCDVDIIAMNTHKQRCEPNKKGNTAGFASIYELVETDIKIRLLPALLNLFTKKSYNISRFYSEEYEEKIIELLSKNQYDIVILESLYSTTSLKAIRENHKGKVVLRSHNIEFNIWNNLSKNERNPIKKKYLNLLTTRLKAYELRTSDEVDLIASISKVDIDVLRKLGCKTPQFHLPFGIDMNNYSSEYRSTSTPETIKIYHIGSMNWIPHQESFKWFFNQVWPKLNSLGLNIELHLAGTGMPKWMIAKNSKNIFVNPGYVDGKSFAKGKQIMVVPSFSGSGIRIKIIEAMALGKTVLTTKNGAMGIDCTHAQNIYISDNAADWVSILSDLVVSPDKRFSIGNNAVDFCRKNHDLKVNAKLLLNYLN